MYFFAFGRRHEDHLAVKALDHLAVFASFVKELRLAGDGIGLTVIAYVDQKIEVHASDRFHDHALCFTCAEAGQLCFHKICIPVVA